MERREEVASAIKFADLELRQIIGVGSFGQVRLVLHKPTQVPYALKAMYKGQVRTPLRTLDSPSRPCPGPSRRTASIEREAYVGF